MDTITTKRSKLQLLVAFSFLVYLSICGITLVYVFRESAIRALNDLKFDNGRELANVVAGIFLIFLSFYPVYVFFQNAPIIRVDTVTIRFNNDSYQWSDVMSIVLTGKQPYKSFMKTQYTEGAKFVFKTGRTRYLFDSNYSNSWQVKLFIQKVVLEKSTYTGIAKDTGTAGITDESSYRIFKGNPLTSGMFIYIWCITGGLAYGLYSIGPNLFADVLLGMFLLFLVVLQAFVTHYFIVSEDMLVVRSYILFWRNDVYKLSNIKEAVIGSRKNTLRIITKDLKSKLYPASTLSSAMWDKLREHLESVGISVRDESSN